MSDANFPSLSLSERLKSIQDRIKKAAEKSGRSSAAVTLVAVGKTVSPQRLTECVQLGVRDIGENKIQEALAKRSSLPAEGVTHHFIGHLQTNKARKAIENFDLIQTVGRPDLAEVLNRICGETGRKKDCLMEINVSGEATKSGVPMAEAEAFLESFSRYTHLNLRGLMTIGPNNATADETRACFRSFVDLAQRNEKVFGVAPILSFGMSDDFESAIEEGATMVRLGRALFGERTT